MEASVGSVMLFAWGPEKAVANLAKHGFSFEEASTVFGDSLALTIDDPHHADLEDRFVTLGLTGRRRLAVVVHTDRGDHIWIVTARVATSQQRTHYESAT